MTRTKQIMIIASLIPFSDASRAIACHPAVDHLALSVSSTPSFGEEDCLSWAFDVCGLRPLHVIIDRRLLSQLTAFSFLKKARQEGIRRFIVAADIHYEEARRIREILPDGEFIVRAKSFRELYHLRRSVECLGDSIRHIALNTAYEAPECLNLFEGERILWGSPDRFLQSFEKIIFDSFPPGLLLTEEKCRNFASLCIELRKRVYWDREREKNLRYLRWPTPRFG
ncbi:MAG: hypothetical protein KDD64_00320 [Bdellovibrionales bacterium]|nr:hypothetical protein [Bdellovibrionales bacterium]